MHEYYINENKCKAAPEMKVIDLFSALDKLQLAVISLPLYIIIALDVSFCCEVRSEDSLLRKLFDEFYRFLLQ